MAFGLGKDGGIRFDSLAALLLLCLIWAGTALRPDLLPDLLSTTLPPLERQVIPLALFALLTGLFATIRRAKWPRGRRLLHAVLVGLGLFTVPAVLVSFSAGWISAVARTALFTLVPVFAVAFEPFIGDGPTWPMRSGLLAALTSLAGALLVFPIAMPSSLEAAKAFVSVFLAPAMVAAANCLGVTECRGPSFRSAARLAGTASVAGASAAIGLVVASLFLERSVYQWNLPAPELVWSIAVELPGLILLFWLMPRMSAPQMATRYALAPLLVILIGVVFLRSTGQVRLQTWLGLAGMTAGAGWLLFASHGAADAPNSHLNLSG